MASGRDMEPAEEDFKNVDDTLLTEQDISDIQKAVHTLCDKYYQIGIGLGINAHRLDAIRHDYRRCDDAWTQTILTWLKRNYDCKRHGHPSWRRLVLAIECHDRALAETIADEHSIVTSNLDLIPPTKRQKLSSSPHVTTPSTPKSTIDHLEYLTQTLHKSYLKLSIGMWPPHRPIPFVELALVQMETESLHLDLKTIKGNMSDEILGHGRTATVTLDSILKDVEYGSLILFEGRPGCGKTTLLIKIACDLANRTFDQKLVVLVHLRQLSGKENISLQDLFRTACSALSQEDIDFLSVHVERDSGENVILIFDGFDEYPPGRSETNLISKIIFKQCLLKSTVMVSSRPIATYEFRNIAAKWIEVKGFRNKEIAEFIKCCISDTEKAQILVKHLEEHQSLINLCYLPLHCAMVVHYHRSGCYALPTTKSSFFKQFILSILYRSFHKKKKLAYIPKQLSSFEDLPSPYSDIFYKVCELAFHATIASKQVFTLTELNEIGLSISLNINHGDLDLLVIDCYFVMSGIGESYTFLHLTLQEYLAAVHISRFDDAQKAETVRSHGDKQHLETMWTFLCGMIDYTSPTMQMLVKDIIDSSNHTTFHMQCAYESQHTPMCTHVFQQYSSHFTFDNKAVQPLDLTPFTYVLKKVNITRTLHLHLKDCSFPSVDRTIQLLRDVSDYPLSLEISYGQAVKSVLDALGSPGITMDKLIRLEIIGDHELLQNSTVTGLNKCTSIETLKISWINIGLSEVNDAFRNIRWETLKTLDLGWCNLHSRLAKILAERLQYTPNLADLDICQNSIGNAAARKLIQNLLQYCKNLHELNLDSNGLSDDSIPHLSELITSADQLTELKLVIQAKIKSKKENLFSPSGWERLMIARKQRESMIKLNIIGKPLCGIENINSENSDIKEHTMSCSTVSKVSNDNIIIDW